MKICVIGTGYVGLVTGTCFAESGNDVICIDNDKEKLEVLQSGEIPFYEPGLHELVMRNVEEGRLSFGNNISDGVRRSSVIFIAVGTPSERDGSADITGVMEVVREIGRAVNGYKIIAIKSTVPVGTADIIQKKIKSMTRYYCDVVSNPEFLKEGAAVDDFMKPDRVIIGTKSKRAERILKEMYSPFLRTGKPFLVMDQRSAEMTKYASNAMLASRISFVNEIANLCDRVGADIESVRIGIGSDSRIGPQFIFSGVGYGGSCFPKDVRALICTGKKVKYMPHVLSAVERVNEAQKGILVEKVLKHFKGNIRGKRFAVWGLSFKPRTDDMRDAPSRKIIESLLRLGAKVTAYDPEAIRVAEKIFGNKISYASTPYEALKGADALLVVTEWNEFRRPDYGRIKTAMKRHVIFDGRNIYNPQDMARRGFIYYSIGRP